MKNNSFVIPFNYFFDRIINDYKYHHQLKITNITDVSFDIEGYNGKYNVIITIANNILNVVLNKTTIRDDGSLYMETTATKNFNLLEFLISNSCTILEIKDYVYDFIYNKVEEH